MNGVLIAARSDGIGVVPQSRARLHPRRALPTSRRLFDLDGTRFTVRGLLSRFLASKQLWRSKAKMTLRQRLGSI